MSADISRHAIDRTYQQEAITATFYVVKYTDLLICVSVLSVRYEHDNLPKIARIL
jgi:hypothetical protein